MAGILEPLLPYAAYLIALVRVWVGANFMAHGYPKVGKGRQQTVQFMKSLGIPAGATYLAAILEFFGGLFLIIGFIVPIVALFLFIEMIATTILKKVKMKGPYLTGQNPAAYELDITYILLAIVIMVFGAGGLSIDSLVGL